MSDIRIDISRARSSAVGAEHGITAKDLRDIESPVAKAHKTLLNQRRKRIYGFWDLYKDRKTLADVKKTAQAFRKAGIENLVVLGIGGSALGTTALVSAIMPPYYNLLDKKARRGAPRIFVMDNIDPDTFAAMMALCPPEKTLYNAISKSGGTAETNAQLMIALEAIEKTVGAARVRNHLIVTTNPRGKNAPKSLLHPVADQYKLKEFTVPLNVGGRFSVFSPVGMFPAAMLGMNVDAFFRGCAAMDKRCSKESLANNPAYLRAAVHYIACAAKSKSMSVMMPYADALRDVADWYRQLWAESLGKQFSLDGEKIFAGQTPIKALGATDQHSQIQLFREGPNDKIINILEVTKFRTRLSIPKTLAFIPELEYLRGATMNKLMNAELRGTMDALKASRRPVVRVTLPAVNEHTVAQLLYMLEVETAMAGLLFNVNTFDQPGVEEGKRIARKLMGGRA